VRLLRPIKVGFVFIALICGARGTDSVSPAKVLASQMSALRENNSTEVYLRMQVVGQGGIRKDIFQIRIKERRAPMAIDIAYQILWPKERKGEAILIHQAPSREPVASLVIPGEKQPSTKPMKMSEAVFGSDLALADTIEDFFVWKNQGVVGNETIDRVNCVILESKPGDNDSSIYSHVRSWVDTKRMVPLRVEKYLPSGQLARRIETTRVVPQGSHGNLPANLTVRDLNKSSSTELDGSRIRWDAQLSDSDFTPDGACRISPPIKSQIQQ
jgi:hypothetical protein